MPDEFRRLFEGPDEIEQLPDRFGRVGEGATEIRDPTEEPIGQALFQEFRDAWAEGRALPELFGARDTLEIRAGIGEGRQNRRPDVAKVETLMDALGEHDASPTDGPTGFLNTRLEEDVQRFQVRNGLTVDGIVDPGGETLRQIQGELSRTLGPDALTRPSARPGAIGSRFDAAAEDPLAEFPEGPGDGANLIPTQSSGGLPGSERDGRPDTGERLSREEFLRISRESERRFNEELDRIEQRIKEIEKDGREKGLVIAAAALKHFREGSGKTMNLKRDWLRSFRAVRTGERRVQQHFENWLTGKILPSKNAPHERIVGALARLKDGQTLNRSSEWEAPVAVPWWRQPRSDLHNASGTTRIQSKGSFRLVRKGNKIHLVGRVDHHWNDIYDWKKGEEAPLSVFRVFRHDDALWLQHNRGARPFKMQSRWSQTVTGTISVKEDKRTGRLIIIGIELNWKEPEEGRAPQ